MKTLLLFTIGLFFSATTFAQNGINYKALIKDANGDVVANQAVTIQFQILEDGTTNVYQETHNPTTDGNGIAIVNIGEGTVNSGNFSTIDWGADDHFLNVRVNSGNGLVDLGTTQFGTVPYALAAKNVSGLEKITEGGNNGWRLADTNPLTYGDIGVSAVDLSTSTVTSSTNGATGSQSFTTGRNTIASGIASAALGFENEATATGATALGYRTKSNSLGSLAVGFYNIGGGASNFNPTNPIFEVGNGSNATPSNALTILQNGTVTAPSLDITEITDDKALITKEYFEENVSSGLAVIDEGNGDGHRLENKNPAHYGNIGSNAVDVSYSNSNSEVFGALGNISFASGYRTIATGVYATSMGNRTFAGGLGSMAIGERTNADARNSFAIGNYNVGGGNATSIIDTDPIFEIGIGQSVANRKNAMTVLKNGRIGIGDTQYYDGKFNIVSVGDLFAPQLRLVQDDNGAARINFVNRSGNGGGLWSITGLIDSDDDDSRMDFYYLGSDNIFTLFGNGDATLQGDLSQNSDRRLKKDIETIDYGIAEILQLNPVQYHWKDKTEKPFKSLGVIAQEIEKIIPNVVTTGNDVKNTLSVSYVALIPVLIKAIQEQQEIITAQEAKNNAQETQIASQNEKYATLEKMVLALASKIDSDIPVENATGISAEKK